MPRMLRHYGFAFGSVALAVAVTRLTWPLLAQTPFILLFGATMVAARWTGERAGLVAIPLAAAGYAIFVASEFSPTFSRLGVIVFVALSFGLNRLIVSRNRVEAALRAREAQVRAGWAHAAIGAALVDCDGIILRMNPALERILSCSHDECIGTHFLDFTHPADVEEERLLFADLAAGRRDEYRREQRYSPRSGQPLWGRVVLSLIRDAPDRQTEALLMLEDITDRKGADDALRTSEARFRSFFDGVPTGLYQSTPEGRFVTVNAAFVELFGYTSAAEICALDIARDLYVDSPRRFVFMETLERDGEVRNAEVVLRRKDGSSITVLESARAVRTAAGATDYYEGTLIDITARKSLEEQLRQVQKLDALGRLVAGVAHDFNNLLTAMAGYTELALQDIGSHESASHDLEEVLKVGRRAAALTRQLLVFSRRPVLDPEPVRIDTVIASLEPMLEQLLGENIRIVTGLRAGEAQIKVDSSHLEQIVVNLAINARDAMPDGGTLTIETAMTEFDGLVVPEKPVHRAPGPYVMLSTTDTGCGMDETVKAHLFEPFYTTKGPDRGTGLGLATVYGIVKQSGGYVWVYSEPGRGSTFRLYFPQTPSIPAPAVGPVPPSRSLAGSRTVLVVEDDASVRTLACTILRTGGYDVLEAATGERALDLAAACPGLDLVVTDLVMPGISGGDLVRRLRPRHPGVRALYMSGFGERGATVQGLLAAESAFLSKPFTRDQLLAEVRRVLDLDAPAGTNAGS